MPQFQYQALAEPVQQTAEQVGVDKWFREPPDPPRPPKHVPYALSGDEALTLGDFVKENITLDKWYQHDVVPEKFRTRAWLQNPDYPSLGQLVGNTYYIAAAGNDAHDGLSPATAWLTISKVNGRFTGRNACPGDTYLFNGGDSFSGNLHLQLLETRPTKILTIGNYGAGTPTISCGSGAGIEVDNLSNVLIDPIFINGSGVTFISSSSCTTGSTSPGLYAHNDGSSKLSNLTITSCSVTGCLAGITVLGNQNFGFSSVSLNGCITFANANWGLFIGAPVAMPNNEVPNVHDHVTISTCQTYSNYGITSGPNSTNDGYGMILANTSIGLIAGCVAHDNGAAGENNAGIMLLACNSVTVQDCEVYNQFDPTGVAGQGIEMDSGAQNCVVQRCYVHECDNAGFAVFGVGPPYPQTSGNTFQNSIVQNCGQRGIPPSGLLVQSYSDNTIVQNCTFYDALSNASRNSIAQFAASFSNAAQVLTFLNNIVSSPGIGNFVDARLYNSDTMTFLGNLYDATSAFNWQYDPQSGQPGGGTYTSLTALHTAALSGPAYLEYRSGVAYGFSVAAKLVNPGTGGVELPTNPVSTLIAYDLQQISPAINTGINSLALIGVTAAALDFHGNANSVVIAGTSFWNIGAVETIKVYADAWQPQPPDPPRSVRRSSSLAEYAAEAMGLFTIAVIYPDKYYTNPPDPVRPLKHIPNQLGDFEAEVLGVFTPQNVDLDAWYQEDVVPQRNRARSFLGDFAIERGVFIAETVGVDKWYNEDTTPQRVRKRWYFGDSEPQIMGVVFVIETITVDKWYTVPAEPQKNRARTYLGHFGTTLGVFTAQTVMVDSWYTEDVVPQRLRVRSYLGDFEPKSFVTFVAPVQTSWYPTLPGPVVPERRATDSFEAFVSWQVNTIQASGLPLLLRVPDVSTPEGVRRLRRFTEILSQIINSLSAKGKLKQTGPADWDIFP